MAYCTVSEVQALEAGRQLVFSDSPATRPTLTQVNSFIAQIASEIDQTILRQGYKVPLTTNAYLTMCNSMGAAMLVELALCVDGNIEASNPYKFRKEEYQLMLKSIEENPRLAGAESFDGGGNVYDKSDGTSAYINTNAQWKIAERQW